MEDSNNSENLVEKDSTSGQFSQNPQSSGIVRHKLKKIKRPKIHPMSDNPPAPSKVPGVDSSSSLDNAEQSSDGKSGVSGSELITSKDAKSLATENNYHSPYVLESLPPELDYITDEEAEIGYAEVAGHPTKKIVLISLVCLVVGLFLGATLFGSKTEERHGLEGVVLNPDVPAGRARCGLTDKSQACTFYIMNCYKQELTGRDFYKLAAQLTSREEYMIETENLRYSMVKIKPGHFAQINIPALK